MTATQTSTRATTASQRRPCVTRSAVSIVVPSVADGRLRIVAVAPGSCLTSWGEELIVRFEKLQTLVEQVCQERCVVTIRTWTGKDGVELIQLHRDGEPRIENCSDATSSEVF